MSNGDNQPRKLLKNLETNLDQALDPFVNLVFDQLGIGVVKFDKDLNISHTNSIAEKLIDTKTVDQWLAGSKRMGKGISALEWKNKIKSIITSRQNRTFDRLSRTINGKSITLSLLCMPLLLDKTSSKDGIIIIEDVTEKTDLQKQLAEAERLSALGRHVSKITHELNNPMDGILRYINLAIRSIEEENLDKPKDYLQHCKDGLMRMVQIISELLEFSRGSYVSLEYVNIEQILEESLKTMIVESNALNIQVVKNYTQALPKIRSGNLYQVFCNLIKNAIDAIHGGGELRISSYLTTDNLIAVEVSDSGDGFDPEDANAIFEPFFTTKEKGKGTGLGLAICKDIVNRYHGHITAENIPEGGSKFIVYLPLENS